MLGDMHHMWLKLVVSALELINNWLFSSPATKIKIDIIVSEWFGSWSSWEK
jgi:hypothetical protein